MSNTTVRIANCLERLASGDERAREDLIAHALRRLRVLTERMFRDYPRLHRWEQADDVFQQAMLRLDRALRAVTPRTTVEFLGLASLQIRRELSDLVRRHFGPEGIGANHASVLPMTDGIAQLDPIDSTHDPDQLRFWSEFHEAVDLLPDAERQVFELLWYHELTHAEAAEVLGIELRQLRKLWQEARLRLREALVDYLPGGE